MVVFARIPRLLTLVLVSIAVPATGCGGGAGRSAARPPAVGDGLPSGLAGRPAPPIRLADARGGTLDTRAFAGRPYAVTFLYTRCPDVCPLIGDELRGALERLGAQARRVAVVAVSVDPRHDTAAAVHAWLRRHREPASFHYAIGPERELRPVWRSWFVSPQGGSGRVSGHSAIVWLVDKRGRLAGLRSAGAPIDPGLLARDLSILAGRS